MGFSDCWVTVLLHYVCLVTYYVTMNGDLDRLFSPGRGLRQGDPLSCEGLSSLLRQAVRDNLICGARLSRGGHYISHLVFANDCLLFGGNTIENALVLRNILIEYERLLGQ